MVSTIQNRALWLLAILVNIFACFVYNVLVRLSLHGLAYMQGHGHDISYLVEALSY